jgi:hypothetical protein
MNNPRDITSPSFSISTMNEIFYSRLQFALVIDSFFSLSRCGHPGFLGNLSFLIRAMLIMDSFLVASSFFPFCVCYSSVYNLRSILFYTLLQHGGHAGSCDVDAGSRGLQIKAFDLTSHRA